MVFASSAAATSLGARVRSGICSRYSSHRSCCSSVRLILTWVFNSTGGSLPLVALLHASFDVAASGAILTGFFPGLDGRLMYFGLAIVAIGVLVMTRGRLGYRGPSAVTIPVAGPAPSPGPLSRPRA